MGLHKDHDIQFFFSHEIMTKTLDRLSNHSNHYHTPVKIGNIGNNSQASGFVEVLLRMLRFQRLAQSELSQSEQPSCHGTTMDPQDRKKSRFQISRKYLVASCCFMQCTSSASIFPRRRRFLFDVPGFMAGFMAYGDHM